MKEKRVKVPTYAWYGDKENELHFPSGWSIKVCKMSGHDEPQLSEESIQEKLSHPIGTEPLRELAKGKRSCVILVDDLTRPTKASQVLPAILDEIRKGGICDEHISFVMAHGAHMGRRLSDYLKKLGEDIPSRFEVFNHNIYENNEYLGVTSRGTPVYVNKEVMSCDLKVAVGLIVPHPVMGFGGGAKIVCPGVASIDTIEHNHKITEGRGLGIVERSQPRLDAEECARMAGLDFIVNLIINANRDCVDVFCGDLVEAHREGVKTARRHYATKIMSKADVAVGNGYPLENEGYKAFNISIESVRKEGDVVILVYSPEGCVNHNYLGKFGKNHGGRAWRPDYFLKRPWKMRSITVVTPHHQLKDEWYYGVGSTWVKTWGEALEILQAANGDNARVAVYPCASIQISDEMANRG